MTGFLLDLHIIHERLTERGLENNVYAEKEEADLEGIRFYEEGQEIDKKYIYLLSGEQIPENGGQESGVILCRDPKKRDSCIVLSGKGREREVFQAVQDIFGSYLRLERNIAKILSGGGSIQEIVELAAEHFGSCIFFHDEYYQILADQSYLKAAKDIQYDQRKGIYVQDAKIINQFRTSPSYRETMHTRGGHLWESDYDESRAVYANVWVGNNYRGRLILTEEGAPFTKGKMTELGYFAEAVSVLVKYGNTLPVASRGLERLMTEAVNGRGPERVSMREELYSMEWSPEDLYICGVISLIGSDVSRLSVYSICANLEEKIKGSCSCYGKGYIYMVVNLTVSRMTAQELRMQMAYVIRDGLMHMGVSNVFQDFYSFPIYLKQAMVTLQYSEKAASTIWYSEFRFYALEYWLSEGIGTLTKEAVLPPELGILKYYDEKNNGKLLETLKVYLRSERNSTLTSQILKIHRSTLPSRLRHIQQLTGLNLEDYDTRLYLMAGFYALEHL